MGRDFLKGLFRTGDSEAEKSESCMPEFNVTDEPMRPRLLAPNEFATKIIVAGDLQQSKDTAKAVMQVQKELAMQVKKDFPDTKLLMSVETFLDDCRHSTDWSSKPADIGSTSTRWHCYQSNTRFNEAFDAMRKGEQHVDVVIIVGDRFNDNLEKTTMATQKQHDEKGTKFFAMPTTSEESVQRAYAKITENSGGLALPYFKDNSYDDLVREITQATLFRTSGKSLDALPEPKSNAAKSIRLQLEKLES